MSAAPPAEVLPESGDFRDTRRLETRISLGNRWMGLKKIFLLAVVALPVAVGAVFGILWYQALPLKTARYYRDSGDLPAAMASVEEYLTEFPDDVDGLSLKAQILCQQGRYDESAAIYTEIGPSTEKDFVCFTESLVALQAWSMAVSTTQTYDASDLEPNSQIYFWGIISQTNLGNVDAALTSAEKLARMEGQESLGLLLYGELKLRQNARPEAMKAWEQVLKINPEGEGFHIPAEVFYENYVSTLIGMGRLDDAMEVADKGLAQHDSASLHFLKGNIYKDLNQIDAAKQEWTLANVGGNHVGAHLALATQLLAEGQPKLAALVMNRLSGMDTIDSRHAFVMQNICEALDDGKNAQKWNELFKELSREERVENSMTQVITDYPTNAWSRVFQAYFHAKEGRWEQADRMLQLVKEEDFAEEEAYLVLRQAIKDQKFTIEVIKAMEEKGIGISE